MHACAQAPGGNGIVLYATMYRGHEIITLLYKTATKDTHSDSTCEIWSRQSPRDREDKPPEAKDKNSRDVHIPKVQRFQWGL